MIEFVLVLFMMAVVIFGGFLFLAWVVRETIAARKYRHLVKLAKAQAATGAPVICSGPRWEVSYREKGKIKKEVIEANSEGEALKLFTKSLSVGYGKIENVRKI